MKTKKKIKRKYKPMSGTYREFMKEGTLKQKKTFQFFLIYMDVREKYTGVSSLIVYKDLLDKDPRTHYAWKSMSKARKVADELGASYETFITAQFEFMKTWKNPIPFYAQLSGSGSIERYSIFVAKKLKSMKNKKPEKKKIGLKRFEFYDRLVDKAKEKTESKDKDFNEKNHVLSCIVSGVYPIEYGDYKLEEGWHEEL